MATSKDAGKAASKTLRDKGEDKKAKSAAASALSQRPKKGDGKKK